MADAPSARPAWTRGSAAVRVPATYGMVEAITAEWAWGGARGAGVRVAVIDSGIDADHPALEGSVDVDGCLAVGLSSDGDVVGTQGPHEDLFGHGTACAGIIHQLAPEARLTSIRVLGRGLSGKSEVFLHGLAWAVEQGFDVINLSLGTRRRDWALALYELCDLAYFRGCFLVTAANNVLHPSFPSLYASVASVACNLSSDPWRFHYNPEPPTEFLARGIGVDVAWRRGTFAKATGNSYAAPHITGLAALIRSKHPDLRPSQVKAVLMATAANVREAQGMAGRISRSARLGVPARLSRASRALRLER